MQFIEAINEMMENARKEYERAYKLYRRGVYSYNEMLKRYREIELELHHNARDSIMNDLYWEARENG